MNSSTYGYTETASAAHTKATTAQYPSPESAAKTATPKSQHADADESSDLDHVITAYELRRSEAPCLRDAFAAIAAKSTSKRGVSLDMFLHWLQRNDVAITTEKGQLQIHADGAKATQMAANYRFRCRLLWPMQAAIVGLLGVSGTLYCKDILADRVPPTSVRLSLIGTLLGNSFLSMLSAFFVGGQEARIEAHLSGAIFSEVLHQARAHHNHDH